MSAPVAADVLRELGAEKRTFRTVRLALLWYRDQLAAKLRVNRDPSSVGMPSSRALRDQREATFAAVAQCLRQTHPADGDDADEARAACRGQCVVWLLASYEARWGDLTLLSERAGLTRWAFSRRCARTERYLRKRMQFTGLLEKCAA